MAYLIKNLLEFFENVSWISAGNWLGLICTLPDLVAFYHRHLATQLLRAFGPHLTYGSRHARIFTVTYRSLRI